MNLQNEITLWFHFLQLYTQSPYLLKSVEFTISCTLQKKSLDIINRCIEFVKLDRQVLYKGLAIGETPAKTSLPH